MNVFENVIRRLGDGELVGASRVEAAHLAEREKCAQVCESYLAELNTWTEADDHGQSPETKRAVAAVLLEAARRIRERKDAPRKRGTRARSDGAASTKIPPRIR